MPDTFNALRVHKTDAGTEARFEDLTDADLMPGEVTVRVSHSTVNYKDGLAVTGRSPVVRTFPLIPGIDFAGTVESSTDDSFSPGERVVLTGWGVGETHHGGFSQKARVKADWLIKLPDHMRNDEAMAIGTAGFTAMLCVLELEHRDIDPKDGDVVVTGAAGGSCDCCEGVKPETTSVSPEVLRALAEASISREMASITAATLGTEPSV